MYKLYNEAEESNQAEQMSLRLLLIALQLRRPAFAKASSEVEESLRATRPAGM